MRTRPVVSVCIANYNGSAIIAGCIDSVLAQDCDFPMEILVHDDASTDGSAELLASDYPNVHLIRSDSNVGFCIANNRMVAQAEGTYILLLNNDAELYPSALRVLYEKAEKIGEPAILSLPQYDFFTGKLIDRGCLLDPFFNPVPNLDPGRSDVAMVIGACLWIPRQLWRELSGFPEWFGSIAEDMYLCCRARLAGYAVQALTESGYRHWQGRTFGGNRVMEGHLDTTIRRRALSERNKSFVMALTYPAPLFHLIFPMHLFLLLAEGLVLALLKREWRMFQDIYMACMKSLWRERRILSRLRQEIKADMAISWQIFVIPFIWRPHKLGLLLRHGIPRIS